mmetsp:Transcript_8144/g.11733  ORF Transcript_8144/g.11733 Transcript_8144/m.11733 type:complete len:170 (+) Transcript_8144:159-668(+)
MPSPQRLSTEQQQRPLLQQSSRPPKLLTTRQYIQSLMDDLEAKMESPNTTESAYSSNSHPSIATSDDSDALLTQEENGSQQKNDTPTNHGGDNYISNGNTDVRNPVHSFVDKSAETTKFLRDALQGHFVFEKMTQEQQGTFIKTMQPKDAEEGDVIIKKGDSGDYLNLH